MFEIVSSSFTSCRQKILNLKKKLGRHSIGIGGGGIGVGVGGGGGGGGGVGGGGGGGFGGSAGLLLSGSPPGMVALGLEVPLHEMGAEEQGADPELLAKELLEAEVDIYWKHSELVNHSIQEGMLSNIRNFPRFKVGFGAKNRIIVLSNFFFS